MASIHVNGQDPQPTKDWKNPEWVRWYNRQYRKKAKKAKMKAKVGKKKAKRNDRYDDAIVYLRHAVAKMDRDKETMSDLLVRLALKTLEGV